MGGRTARPDPGGAVTRDMDYYIAKYEEHARRPPNSWRLDGMLPAPRRAGIYALRCPDGRVYVGRAINLYGRRCSHAGAGRSARRGQSRVRMGRLLAEAFAEHPPSEWVFEVLEYVDDTGAYDRLARAESHWIDALRPELNTALEPLDRWWL